MSIRLRFILAVCLAAFSAAGCEVSKSSNPLSPSVAGPIAGVQIGKPAAMEPGQDWQISIRDQPLKLLFQNVTSSGVRPLTYTIEIASDATFGSIVFKRTGIAPSPGDTTSFQLPSTLETGRTYWWRVRAEDGANSSEYSSPQRFQTLMPVVLGPPYAALPSGAAGSLAPDFVIYAGQESGPVERIHFTVQVAEDNIFTKVIKTFVVEKTGQTTTISEHYAFPASSLLYWRVQAKDIGDSQAVSPWSLTQAFSMPAPPPPPSSGGGGGGGPVGGGNWQACGSTPGDTLVACVRSAVYVTSTEANAFEITKRVAWLLRNQGFGLLIKNGGENIITWQGYSFSISRIVRSNGALIKVLSDAGTGGTNGATWDDSQDYPGAVSPSLYVPSINPDLP